MQKIRRWGWGQGTPSPFSHTPPPHFSPFLHTSGLLDLSAWKRRKQEQTNYSFLNFVWSRICLLHGIEISSNSTDDKKTWKTTNYFLNFLVFPFSSGFANIIDHYSFYKIHQVNFFLFFSVLGSKQMKLLPPSGIQWTLRIIAMTSSVKH